MAAALSEDQGYDLSAKNPNGGEAVVHRSPQDIMDEISRGDEECAEIIESIA